MDPVRRAALTHVAYFMAIGTSWASLPVRYRGAGLGLATDPSRVIPEEVDP